MTVYALRDATPACGGKALGLAKLIAAGLPVPDGFVIDDAAFRALAGPLDLDDPQEIGHRLSALADRILGAALPADLAREVDTRARELAGATTTTTVPWRGATRSEVDARARELAGATTTTTVPEGPPMFAVRSSASIEDGEVGAAAGVFSSQAGVPFDLLWPAIRNVWLSALTPLAVAYARRRRGEVALGVIVQRFIAGEPVAVYTREPGKPEGGGAAIQRRAGLTIVPRDAADPALALALRAEAAIDAPAGADVELVEGWVVQARPIVHPKPQALAPPPPIVLAPLHADQRPWRWDIAHNPDPLSVAQTALVERVERAEVAPYAMRVTAGYLYTAPRRAPERGDATLEDIERRLAEILGAEVPPLAEAIDRYVAFYRVWSNELAPLVAAARSATPAAPGSRPSAVEATIAAAARGEISEAQASERLGILAPAWDVAVPTYGERPGLIERAIANARALALPPAAQVPDSADLAERDDTWFARAQLLVRRAILRRAGELGIAPDDAFWIPVEDLLEGDVDPDTAHRRASGARNAAARTAKWAMPLEIGVPQHPRQSLRGAGTGPRVSGRVVRFATLASAVTVGRGDIVVARAVTPALAVMVIGCAALVSETGGLLDHGAALARELGIPCVVGCADAWSLLTDGMVVTVDGDAGSVEISAPAG